MKTFFVITEDWVSILEAIKTAEDFLSRFNVSIGSKYMPINVSIDSFYDVGRSHSQLTYKQTKSLKGSFVRNLGIIAGGKGYDAYGIIVDKQKANEDLGLYGQQSSKYNTMEVYAYDRARTQYGMSQTAYTLVHELLHQLADHYNVVDKLHVYVDKEKKDLKPYLDQLEKLIGDKLEKPEPVVTEETIWDKLINFKKKEFNYPDKMDIEFLLKMDSTRTKSDFPFKNNSDWRPDGSHSSGQEMDIDINGATFYQFINMMYSKGKGALIMKFVKQNKETLESIFGKDKQCIAMYSAIDSGITRIGIYNGHMHFGTDPNSPQHVIWTGTSE